MKKQSRLLLVITACLIGLVLANLLIDNRVNVRYQALINNPTLLQAFYNQSQDQINATTQVHRLEYQHIIDNEIVSFSKVGLPNLNLVRFQQQPASGVLELPKSQDFSRLIPQKLVLFHSLYIAFPLCPEDCKSDTYMIYAKVLP